MSYQIHKYWVFLKRMFLILFFFTFQASNVRADNQSSYDLLNAISFNKIEYVKYLIKYKKADINFITSDSSPLSLAAFNGNLKILQHLIIQGAKPDVSEKTQTINLSALFIASPAGLLITEDEIIEALTLLLEKGANLSSHDKLGYVPLNVASRKGYKNVVQFLITKGVNVNEKSKGKTAMEEAAYWGHGEIVELLEKSGATH